MTKTKLLPLLAIVAIAAMMGAASIAPAYAAQKVIDTNDKTSGSFVAFACGTLVDVAFKSHFRFVVWDNDKFKFHSNDSFKLTDFFTGASVGIASGTTNQQGDFVDLPISFQSNFNISCKNAPNTNDHFGSTIHKDGSITFH